MSLNDLDAYVWGSLGMRKHAAGQIVVSRMTRRCVSKWPCDLMLQASPAGQEVIAAEIAKSIERNERQNYGMGIILSLVLSALITEIVKAIFRWWTQATENRESMVVMQQELMT